MKTDPESPLPSAGNQYAIEADEVIFTSAAHMFDIYCQVALWSEWDPETRAASIELPIKTGARGWLKPRQGLKVKMRVARLEPGKWVNFVCPVLGSTMHFEHQIESLADARVRVTHRIRFEGWLSGWLYRHVGLAAHEKLPHTLALLKAYAERQAKPA